MLESATGALGTISSPSICRCHPELLRWLRSDDGSGSETPRRYTQQGVKPKQRHGNGQPHTPDLTLSQRLSSETHRVSPPVPLGPCNNSRWTMMGKEVENILEASYIFVLTQNSSFETTTRPISVLDH